MQDGEAIPAQEAGDWLRKNAKDGQVDITWTVTEPNDSVFAEVLEILFGPDEGGMAA